MGTAARRKAERRELNARPAAQARRQRAKGASSIPTSTVVGALVTVLAVCAIFVYAVMRNSSTATSNGQAAGLTDPNALAPVPSMVSTGQQAPDFTLSDTGGGSHHLAAQRGHPVLLEFFAVWCPVCHGEAPILAKLHDAYAKRGVTFWSVLANPYGKDYETSGRSDLRLADNFDLAWYAATYHVRWPQLVDHNFGAVNQYGVHGYPGLYVIDKHGVVRFVNPGHTSYARLAQALDQALATK